MPAGNWPSGDTTTTMSDHASQGNQTPAEARRALEQFEGSAHDALAQNETVKYELQTHKISLLMREHRGKSYKNTGMLMHFLATIRTTSKWRSRKRVR